MNISNGVTKKIKIIIPVVIILLVLIIVGGIFYLWQKRETKGSPEDYVIKETAEGIIVENKKAGLKVKVPEGWEVQKMEFEEGAVTFYSPKAELEWRDERIVLPIKKGCMIQTTIVYKKMNFTQIEKEARETHLIMGVKSEEFEEIAINNYRALKNAFETPNFGPSIGVYIPVKNRVYSFYVVWSDGEKENCLREFNKFLEVVSIK